jgi:Tol biopolymer transport system component
VAQSATTTQRPSASAGLFGNLGGWIAFGDNRGIWAIDPTRPAARDGRVQLSSEEGTPKAWSPDGSKLLVQRHMAAMATVLFVLNSDGSETRLTKAWFDSGGDFTADGSQVIYASQREGQDGFGIYLIDADGGTPELLLASGPRGLYDTWLYEPTFSPDGKEIAYFDGMGDWGHSLRVMNSDGSGMHVVLENSTTTGASHVMGLEWSPDGEHLVFALDSGGVYVVGVDGSGLVKLNATFENQIISIAGVDPHWSPDGSQISYNRATASGTFDSLIITRSDGTEAQQFDDGRSGPWNPREGRR